MTTTMADFPEGGWQNHGGGDGGVSGSGGDWVAVEIGENPDDGSSLVLMGPECGEDNCKECKPVLGYLVPSGEVEL